MGMNLKTSDRFMDSICSLEESISMLDSDSAELRGNESAAVDQSGVPEVAISRKRVRT